MQVHTNIAQGIGEKIKQYRQRANLSQLDLETEIGASVGSISRIENGTVNPTKETIYLVSKTLNLSDRELLDLLGILPLMPSAEEVEQAIEEAKPYLDRPDVLGYLLDDCGRIHYVGQGFIQLFGIPKSVQDKIPGKFLLEVVTNPEFGIIDNLELSKTINTLALEYKRVCSESPFITAHMDEVMQKSPLFKQIKELAEKFSDTDMYTIANRKAWLKVGGKVIETAYTREGLKRNRRFEIIDYTRI